MTVLITLTVAGANTGPFNLYSDVDGYVSPFESSVPKASLVSGYTSTAVPLGTNVIRVLSQGECANYIDIVIGTPPTTTTTTTPCFRPGGLANFVLSYATDAPYFDFTGSLVSACASLGAIAYTSLTGQALSLVIGQTVYSGIGTDCTLVPTGYYILDGGTTVIYIVNGVVDSYPSCPTTTTTTTSAPIEYDYYLANRYDCGSCTTDTGVEYGVCFPVGTSVNFAKFYASPSYLGTFSYKITSSNPGGTGMDLILSTIQYNSCLLACPEV